MSETEYYWIVLRPKIEREFLTFEWWFKFGVFLPKKTLIKLQQQYDKQRP